MRGRYAPSPTGELHLGNLRTALIAWLCSRSSDSGFLLRIEDLDSERVREEHLAGQIRDLRALGIDWDGKPTRQSERLDLHADALERLRTMDRLYPCFCSRREVREAASAPHGPERVLYPGTCRHLAAAAADRRIAAGEPFALRLRSEQAQVDITDARHGPYRAVADDIVVRRRDGAVAYNLAVVVDDADQGIEEVVRGDDLLASTVDQALLYDLLGVPRPRFFHVPLVVGPDGERLAKRHGGTSLAALAARGIGADRVRRMLIASIGYPETDEGATPEALIERFRRDALPIDPWLPDLF